MEFSHDLKKIDPTVNCFVSLSYFPVCWLILGKERLAWEFFVPSTKVLYFIVFFLNTVYLQNLSFHGFEHTGAG